MKDGGLRQPVHVSDCATQLWATPVLLSYKARDKGILGNGEGEIHSSILFPFSFVDFIASNDKKPAAISEFKFDHSGIVS